MKKWLLLAVVGLMSACSKSDIEEVNTSIGAKSPIFYASLEGGDETRTYLDANQKMRWTADDRVTIFFGENYNREFAFTGKTGVTSGGFKQISTDDPFYTAEKSSANYAVYPHSVDNILEDGLLAISLPATQSYAEDSFGLNANTMVAVTKTVDDRFLQFKNVCGYLKLNLYGANVTVKSITLTGNNEEPLAGAATVTPTYGGDPSMAWAASGTTTSLTLDCGDGVKIGATEAEATPFWLVVPPTTFTKGFTVTITDTAGNTFTKSSTSKQTITRNISKNMPAFEVKIAPTGPANNEIWYTSTDGNIVEPYAKDAFGVAIKSNTYENGKGVITFDGNVKRIGESAFSDCTSLASIIIPEGVTEIGNSAFFNCSSLASITLPESVTTIGVSAFAGCASLASITLPEGVTEIGNGAFDRCASLASITIPKGVTTIKWGAFADCTSLASITLPEGVTTIGKSAFLRCESLASITLPEGVTTIEGSAFSNCTSLKSITLPEGVTTIGRNAFAECTSLKSVTLPEGMTTIGERAFYNCTSLAKFEGPLATSDQRCIVIDDALVAFAPAGLTEYIIPAGLTTIGMYVFYGCTSLASIIIPEGVTTIGSCAFYDCKSLKSITLPESVTTIESYAFEGCTSLASITLPEGLTTIGKSAFFFCTSLASITLPESVTTIGGSAFRECKSLKSITLPESVTTIESYTFEGCTSLASITLPEGLTTIGKNAFAHCTSLKSVYCKPTTPPTGGSDMFFRNASGRKIYVPAGSVNAYKAAQYWSDYASAIVGYDFETGTIIADTGITDNSLDSSKYLVYVGNHSTAFAVTSSRDYNVWETYFEHSASGFSVAEYKFQLPEITTAWTPISDDDITIKGSVIRVYNGSRYNNNDDRVPVYTSFDLSTIDVDPTSVITLRIDDANDVVTINGKEMKGAIETAMSKYIYSSYYYEYDEGAYRQYDGIGEGTKLYYAKGWDEYGRLKYLGYASKAINPDTANEEACWKSQCYTNNSIEEKETFANNRYLSGEYIPLGMGNL